MFDPFEDFATAGYLRNFEKERNLDIVKAAEHDLFRANLPDAAKFLARKGTISYADFLEVHRVLFCGLYPWAGEDRLANAPGSSISKGNTIFAHPASARLAVEEGLRIGHDASKMRSSPGLVMGLFAFGHPFLDGNGRTMLIVHSELCHRAGFSIQWNRTSKSHYLKALSDEIASPNRGLLDQYVLPFVGARQNRAALTESVLEIRGLDGLSGLNKVEGNFDDAAVAGKYERFEHKRGYGIGKHGGVEPPTEGQGAETNQPTSQSRLGRQP